MNYSIFTYLITLPLLVLLYFAAPRGIDPTHITWLIIVLLFLTIPFIFTKEKKEELRGQILKHSNLVLLGYVIVHFQAYIDYAAGNISATNNFIWVDHSVVAKGFSLSLIGIACFFLGYLLCSRNPSIDKSHTSENAYSTKALKFLAILLLFTYLYTINPLYILGGYGAIEMGAAAKYASLGFNSVIFAIFIQEHRNLHIKKERLSGFFSLIKSPGLFVLTLVTIYLATVVLSGDRGPLISYSLLYLSGYLAFTKRKIHWAPVVLMIFVISSTVNILGIARSYGSDTSFTEKIVAAINKEDDGEGSISPATKELAASVNTLHHALNYIPSHHDFLFGRFQIQQLLYAIPFSGSLTGWIFNDNSSKYLGVSEFITWIAQGDNPTYGNGSSVVADFYIAFGALGVGIGMLAFGWLMRIAELKMYSDNLPSVFWHAFWVVYFCNSIYIARSSLLDGVKLIFTVMIIMIINKYAFNNKAKS